MDPLHLFWVHVRDPKERATETFSTWRECRHDDTVLAIACAAWVAEHVPMGELGCA
jgi:hypothetical protein